MRLTEFSLRNPLTIGALTIALLIFGLVSYGSMGVSIIPNVSFPGVLITTTHVGADPATIESQITEPLEDAIATLPNIDAIYSSSLEGVSIVQVLFTTAANVELAPIDVERAVNSSRNLLPPDADPPTILKFDFSAIPVLAVGLSGPQPLDELGRVARDRIERAFGVVPGVQSVSVGGAAAREIQVKVDPKRLEAYGVGLNTVQLALQSEQVQAPAGQLTADGTDVNIRFNGLVSEPNELLQIVLTSRPGGQVYLRDVATVIDGFKTADVITRVNGAPAVTLTVTKLANANTIAVSEGIRRVIVELEPTLPQGMRLNIVNDAATYTQRSFETIQTTLFQAILLTGVILLLFLHTWRSTAIVLVSIPTSLFVTFWLMNLLGMNLNLLSMLALTLSVGILVDDSIVVLENIYRHLSLGEPPVLAAINGRSEIGLAAITITFVDVVVFVPIALISGIVGEFIRPYALVVAAATLTSLVVSFTLTPLLAGRMLNQSQVSGASGGLLAGFGRWWDRGFAGVGRAYQRLLRRSLSGYLLRFGRFGIGARWGVIALGIAAFAGGLALFASGRIGTDIFPSGDQSQIDMTLTMPPATTLENTHAIVQQIEQKLASVPEITEIYSRTGTAAGGFVGGGGDTANLTVLLTPAKERTRTSAQIADELRRTLDPHIPSARLDLSLPSAFGNFGATGAVQPILIYVRGPDQTVLRDLVEQVTTEVAVVDGAVEVNNANQKTQPEFVVNVDRTRAADFGITAQSAASALRVAVSGMVVSKFRQPGRDDVDIRLITTDAFRASPQNLASLPLQSNRGALVHLGQVGTIVTGSAPTQIDRVDRVRSVLVSAAASERTVGSVLQDIQTRLAQLPLPPGYSITYEGEAAQGEEAFTVVFQALGTSLLLMYALMLVLFGSVTLPLAVLVSLPLAIIGALGALALTGNSFTFFSLLGIAMLVGLVGKNAILLVDFTKILRNRGLSRTEALLEAGPTRLRPIVMTTMSIFAGLTPVALGVESGSELLRAAALVLVGGLLTSTLLTLVFVPAMYTVFDDIEEFIRSIFNRLAKPRSMEPAELAILQGRPTSVALGASTRATESE